MMAGPSSGKNIKWDFETRLTDSRILSPSATENSSIALQKRREQQAKVHDTQNFNDNDLDSRGKLDKMKTTWKDIQPVPTSQEFLDIVLSRTQRRLPTQIRAGFQISRIRSESTGPGRGLTMGVAC